MCTDNSYIKCYLAYCTEQKRLDPKTVRAYQIDLNQFAIQCRKAEWNKISVQDIESFICHLNQSCKAKTVKRKIASLKAFFRYLEYKDYIESNPFHKIQIQLREPLSLPKTIPLSTIQKMFQTIYREITHGSTPNKRKKALRNAAVCELLFATGMRISELCSLTPAAIDLTDKSVLINGKGAKERKIQIANSDVVAILTRYKDAYSDEIKKCRHFFANPDGSPLSDQTVRRMINRYTRMADIEQHITPHMFRHTFASGLLDADVDIRYIQKMLGHSSIHTTEIYTHVTMAKQKDILTRKHPRNLLDL